MLEGEDFVELLLELSYELLLIVIVPWLSWRMWVVRGRFGLIWSLEVCLQVVVGYVVCVIVSYEGGLKIMTEPVEYNGLAACDWRSRMYQS